MAVGAERVGGGTSLDVTESDLAFFSTNFEIIKKAISMTKPIICMKVCLVLYFTKYKF